MSKHITEVVHVELLRSVARRESDGPDGWVKRWLEVAVVGDYGTGSQHRANRARWEHKGPDAPLPSNVDMRRFILGWKTLGHARWFGAEIVNYADEFVIWDQVPTVAMWGWSGR